MSERVLLIEEMQNIIQEQINSHQESIARLKDIYDSIERLGNNNGINENIA